MKLFTMGISHISRKLWLNIFIFIQVAVIIISVNVMIANMNSKNILYSPLSCFVEKEGYLFSYDCDDENEMFEKIKKIESKLKGNVNIHRIYNMYGVVSGRGVEFYAYGFDTEFYENMHFTLKEGSWNLVEEDKVYIE